MNKREFDAFWKSCTTQGMLSLKKLEQKPAEEREQVIQFIYRAQRAPILMELLPTPRFTAESLASSGYLHRSRNRSGYCFLHTAENPPTDAPLVQRKPRSYPWIARWSVGGKFYIEPGFETRPKAVKFLTERMAQGAPMENCSVYRSGQPGSAVVNRFGIQMIV